MKVPFQIEKNKVSHLANSSNFKQVVPFISKELRIARTDMPQLARVCHKCLFGRFVRTQCFLAFIIVCDVRSEQHDKCERPSVCVDSARFRSIKLPWLRHWEIFFNLKLIDWNVLCLSCGCWCLCLDKTISSFGLGNWLVFCLDYLVWDFRTMGS